MARYGGTAMTDADREEIRRNLEQKVLHTDRHPDITFVSTAVRALAERHRRRDLRVQLHAVQELFLVGPLSGVREHVQRLPGLRVRSFRSRNFCRPSGNGRGDDGTRQVCLGLHLRSASLIQLPAIQRLAAETKIHLLPIKVATAADIVGAFEQHAGEAPRVGLIVPPSSVVAVHRNLIIEQAARHGLPAIYANRRYTVDGGLMSYGVDRAEEYRRVASYIDRILRGAKAPDLPVQQPERFEFLLNLKTARALRLEVPRLLLARANQVIE